jgi:hypothetical protein
MVPQMRLFTGGMNSGGRWADGARLMLYSLMPYAAATLAGVTSSVEAM